MDKYKHCQLSSKTNYYNNISDIWFTPVKEINIDFENKSFTTDDGIEYPFMFDVNPSITIEEFQTLIDKCEENIKDLLDNG